MLLGIAVLTCLNFQASSQNTWQYVGDYKAIIGLYDSQNFVVDNGNRDYKYTADGGTTLQNLGMSISSPKSLYYVEYLTSSRMRAVVFTGGNFELHESTDGGASFTKLSDILPAGMAPLNISPQMVSFDNSESLLTCRVLYNSQLFDVLFRTTDGGNSWNLATADTFSLSNIYDIEIYKDGQVVIASPQSVSISTDRGQTFTQTGSAPPLTSGVNMAFDGNQNIWATNIAGSQNANCYVSTDGGSTWNPWAAVPDGDEVKFIKPSTLLIWGSADTTAISTDGGLTFSTVSFPSTKPAGSILRLAVGGDQKTYFSYDGNAKLWSYGTGSNVGLADWQNAGTISVFPNPAQDVVFLEDYEGPVEFYNNSGQQLKRIEIENAGAIDISDLPPGILILKLDKGFKKILKK